ncbi:MAG: ATP-binding protein [Desulfobacterales bacterium]
MGIKLYYKIFGAFLLTSVLVVTLMIGIMRFYVTRNFTDYVNNEALERLSALSIELKEEYEKHQGWQRLKDDPLMWEKMLRSNPLLKGVDRRKRPLESDAYENQSNEERSPGMRPPKPRDRLARFARGLALFDAQKQHIVGGRPGRPLNAYTLKAIMVNAKTVGWLGLHKREHISNPLVVAFLKRQSQAFYLIGGPILLLAAVVAFVLSKHLLAPIKQLTAGTQALSSRQFTRRIDVQSQDELGQLAADFNTMAQTLEKYEQMRQQWISDISHELRTPLSILRGELEGVIDGVREVNREVLESLHAEVLHVSKIVNDLHQLSLADTGALAFKKEPVDPLQILKNILQIFRSRLEQRKIELQDDLESDEPVIILGDADRLTQLFSNLLENTLRYADVPARLKIWNNRVQNRLMIYIEDSGPGVPEKSLVHLFDRLYRVEKSRSRSQGGSGLGLSICKSIVENLGGEIRAANGTSGGLRIEIVLPLMEG